MNARLRGGVTVQGGTSTGRIVNDTCELAIDNPSQYDCHKVYPFQTDIRGMAIYTVPKIEVQLSGTMQSRPGPEILAQWNVPANVIAQSLGRLPSGGVANIQTNILTAGELYGDRITQVDMRIAKLLRFGRTRTNVGIDFYNLFNSNVPLTYVNDVRDDVGQSAVGARCALREDQRADRFLNTSHEGHEGHEDRHGRSPRDANAHLAGFFLECALFQLGVDDFDVVLDAVRLGRPVAGDTSPGTCKPLAASSTDLPAFFAARTYARNVAVELGVSIRSAGVITVLWPVMIESTSLTLRGFGERVGDLDAAAAVVAVEQRYQLAGEDVAGVHHAQRRKDHPRIAVGVAAPEVIQIDPLRAAADRHLVLERAIGHVLSAVRLEHVRRDAALGAFRRQPLLHVGPGVRVRDEFDRGGKVDVAADVVVVGMGVDDPHHRLRGRSP